MSKALDSVLNVREEFWDIPYLMGRYGVSRSTLTGTFFAYGKMCIRDSPKPVCKKFRGSHKATERYTFVCDNDWGKSGWSATEQDFDDWSLRQYDWNKTLEGASPVVIDECEAKSIGTAGGWLL